MTDTPAKSLWLVEDGVPRKISLDEADIVPSGLAIHDRTLYVSDLGSRVWAFKLPSDGK